MPKSIFESDAEKITSEYNVAEDWQGIMDFCDKVKGTPNSSKEALKCIMKRVNHPIPHVAMQALTLLGACADNCGKPFHLEICSRDWTNEAKTVIVRSHGKVSEKLRELIHKWAEAFKDDAQLNLMVQFFRKLKADGFSFDFAPSASAVSGVGASGQGASSQKDELSFKEDLDLAIAMSLQESSGAQANQAPSSSLYPSVSVSSTPSQPPSSTESAVCEVRALYDFEAAEDNEMTFKAGEIFAVLDNSDENWWKGRNARGVGLFPANFVTTDLTTVTAEKSEKKVHFADETPTPTPTPQPAPNQVTINEEQLDLTLSMLKNASPNGIDDEEETICAMEKEAADMGNLIEKKGLACDDRKEQLEELNEKFLQALALYQQLMKEPVNAMPPSYQTVPSPQQPHSLPYQQQMYAHNIQQQQQQHQGSPLNTRGYSSLPPQHQIEADGAYSQAAAANMLRQQLLSQQQQQQMLQQQQQPVPIPYSSQPASLPPSISSPITLSRQPASLPMHTSVPAVSSPASLPMQQDYSQMNYTPEQYISNGGGGVTMTTTDNNHYPPQQQQTEYVNYGYGGISQNNIPQNSPGHAYTTSVYQ